MAAKKMGRPTSNPKPHKIDLRVDDTTLEILDRYCKKNDVERSEAIRMAIKKLDDEK